MKGFEPYDTQLVCNALLDAQQVEIFSLAAKFWIHCSSSIWYFIAAADNPSQ